MSRHREPEQPGSADREAWEISVLEVACPQALAAELIVRANSSAVYRVVEPDSAIRVVKIVDAARVVMARRAEAAIAGQPGAVTMLRSGHVGAGGYLVMPWHAQSLADRIESVTRLEGSGCLPLVEIDAALRPVAHALAALHAAGLVHADVKPENIALDGAAGILLDLDEVVDIGAVPVRFTPGFSASADQAGHPIGIESDRFGFTMTVLAGLGAIGNAAASATTDPAVETARRILTGLSSGTSGASGAGLSEAVILSTVTAARGGEPGSRGSAAVSDLPRHGNSPATPGLSTIGSGDTPALARHRTVVTPVPVRSAGAEETAGTQIDATQAVESNQAVPSNQSMPSTLAPGELPGPNGDLTTAAQQVWGFVDLRAVTQDRLALQVRPPDPVAESDAAEVSIWRHPAMIVSLVAAAVLVVLAVVLLLL